MWAACIGEASGSHDVPEPIRDSGIPRGPSFIFIECCISICARSGHAAQAMSASNSLRISGSLEPKSSARRTRGASTLHLGCPTQACGGTIALRTSAWPTSTRSPVPARWPAPCARISHTTCPVRRASRSEEHTSELQSQFHLVCRLLLEKKKNKVSNDLNYYYPTKLSSS